MQSKLCKFFLELGNFIKQSTYFFLKHPLVVVGWPRPYLDNGHVQIANVIQVVNVAYTNNQNIVSSDDAIVPNTGENNMEVADYLSANIHDETEENLPEMSQFFLTNNESNIFTSNNNGIYQAQEYSCS